MPGVPPVPIPNTAVKPRAANGSRALGSARVGRCQVYGPVCRKTNRAFFLVFAFRENLSAGQPTPLFERGPLPRCDWTPPRLAYPKKQPDGSASISASASASEDVSGKFGYACHFKSWRIQYSRHTPWLATQRMRAIGVSRDSCGLFHTGRTSTRSTVKFRICARKSSCDRISGGGRLFSMNSPTARRHSCICSGESAMFFGTLALNWAGANNETMGLNLNGKNWAPNLKVPANERECARMMGVHWRQFA